MAELYYPDSFVGPISRTALKDYKEWFDLNVPDREIDADYLAHLREFHGGKFKRTWFESKKGRWYRVGRMLNLALKSSLPKPFQPSWDDPETDLRIEWSINMAMSNGNTEVAFWRGLVPFAILYEFPQPYPKHPGNHPDETQLQHCDLVCFDYRQPGVPAIVVWDNVKASKEMYRCEAAGSEPIEEMKVEKYTDPICGSFTEFLQHLRARPTPAAK